MFFFNNIARVILLWVIVQAAAVAVIYLSSPGPWGIVVFMVFANLIATSIVVYFIWKQQNIKLKKAELNFLQAQINPHFLFNALNTIVLYCRTNPDIARRLLLRLASFLRHTMKKHGLFNSLREEIAYVNTYLILEKARFRDKLIIQRSIDPDLLSCQVPSLILQPIVENAVKHGIRPKNEAGTVSIKIRASAEEVFFIIADDGVGVNNDVLKNVLLPGFGSHNGIGLSNVHERLISLFGKEYGLHIESTENQGTSVYFKVPAIISEDAKGGLINEAKGAYH